MITIRAEVGRTLKTALEMKGLDDLIRHLAEEIRSRMVQSTPIDTKRARQSWGEVRREGGLSHSGGTDAGPVARQSIGFSFGNTAPYSHILDKGSTPGKKPWPSVGPKTTMKDGRIFSSQAPAGIYRTAEIEKFVKAALPGLFAKYLWK